MRFCGLAPVIPVIVVKDVAHAVPLARALVAGGLPVLEVTLRTPVALDVIRAMAGVAGRRRRRRHPAHPADVSAAKAAGARFGVSPGITDELVAACEDEELPLLGGIATVVEAMRMLERGYDVCKFFPAEANGGAPALKAFAGPLPQMNFCPTGGVTTKNAPDYLALPNVLCVGGSWAAEASPAQGGPLGRGRAARDRGQQAREVTDDRRALAAPDEAGKAAKDTPILALFDRDPDRFGTFSVALGDMLLDFSKTAIDARALTLLIELAEAQGRARAPRRDVLAATRSTSPRTAPCCTWRCATAANTPILVDGKNVMPEVNAVLDRMAAFADGIRCGADRRRRTASASPTSSISASAAPTSARPWRRSRSRPITTGRASHFVSNVDGAHIHDTLQPLDPQRTLFIIASKTFTTIETMTNAATARAWMQAALGERRSAAFRRRLDGARQGRRPSASTPDRVFGFWDWVGGRYSVWGAIGLPLMIAIGPRALRRVPRRRPGHGPSISPTRRCRENMPVMLGAGRHLAPQHHGLSRPAPSCPTTSAWPGCPPICSSSTWNRTASASRLDGAAGRRARPARSSGASPAPTASTPSTSSSTRAPTSCPASSWSPPTATSRRSSDHHDLLLANCLAQTEALMRGRTLAEAAAD